MQFFCYTLPFFLASLCVSLSAHMFVFCLFDFGFILKRFHCLIFCICISINFFRINRSENMFSFIVHLGGGVW